MDRPTTSRVVTDIDLCKLCNTRPKTYTCPRCGLGYCNVDCYKSEAHLDCSESFYKQCVEDELKSQENDPEGRNRMVDILKRLHEEDSNENILDAIDSENESQLDSDDEDDPIDLEERLQSINLDNADEVWSALTETERQEFEALVKSGGAEKLLPQWVPWWTYRIKKRLVIDIEEYQEDEYTKKCPLLLNVPIFNELQKASSSVKFNIVNVIYSYAYMALYHNGDYMNCAEEPVHVFLCICENMRDNQTFDDSETAIGSVIQNIMNSDYLPQDEQILLALKEAGSSIIAGPEEKSKNLYISAALSELHRLLSAVHKEVLKEKSASINHDFSNKFKQYKNVNVAKLSKKTLFLHIKKLEYYLSWINYHSKTSL